MVADEKIESDIRNKGPPPIDTSDIVAWTKKLKMFLMKKKRNHLGLEPHGLVRPANNAPQAAKEAYRQELETWKERKDTCISAIYDAAENDSEALEIVNQYLREKEALPIADPLREPLASDLITNLINRFRGELEDEVGDLNSKFTNFKILPGEKVTKGIDRLNGIVQKLSQHGRGPTIDSKLAKLKEALEIPELKTLWVNIALFAEVVATCKRYDKAMEKVSKMESSKLEINFTSTTEKVVCSYPKCGKTGHTQTQCWKKRRDQKIAALKHEGRKFSKSHLPKKEKGDRKGKQAPGNKEYTGCHCCGEKDHRSSDCPDRADKKRKVKVEQPTAESKSNKKPKKSWNRFVRYEERGSDEDSEEEVDMILDSDCTDEEVLISEEDEVVFLDSCASKRLFILKDQSYLENFVYSAGSIQTTRADSKLESIGVGSYKDWKEIRVCNGAVKNICSGGILRDMGYGLSLLRVPRIVRLVDEKEVLVAQYAENGMPYVSLLDLLELPNLTMSQLHDSGDAAFLSDNITDTDPVVLLHQRSGHVCESIYCWKDTVTCCSLEAVSPEGTCQRSTDDSSRDTCAKHVPERRLQEHHSQLKIQMNYRQQNFLKK
jgi:hypothetical protein